MALEAGAAVTIYRLADGMGGEPGRSCARRPPPTSRPSIDEDWPAMAAGRASPATTEALDAVYAALLRYQPADARAADHVARCSTSSTSSPRRGARGS